MYYHQTIYMRSQNAKEWKGNNRKLNKIVK